MASQIITGDALESLRGGVGGSRCCKSATTSRMESMQHREPEPLSIDQAMAHIRRWLEANARERHDRRATLEIHYRRGKIESIHAPQPPKRIA